MVSKEKQTKGFYSTVSEPSSLLSELVPFSKYKMFMVVANTHYEGPSSNMVEFTTKEGGEDHIQQLSCVVVIFTYKLNSLNRYQKSMSMFICRRLVVLAGTTPPLGLYVCFSARCTKILHRKSEKCRHSPPGVGQTSGTQWDPDWVPAQVPNR